MSELEELLKNTNAYICYNGRFLFYAARFWRVTKSGGNLLDHDRFETFDEALICFEVSSTQKEGK